MDKLDELKIVGDVVSWRFKAVLDGTTKLPGFESLKRSENWNADPVSWLLEESHFSQVVIDLTHRQESTMRDEWISAVTLLA